MKLFASAVVLAASLVGGSAYAATYQGDKCGDKYFALTQDGVQLDATLCQPGNSTGANSPLDEKHGGDWINLSELGKTGSKDGFTLSTVTGEWSYDNVMNYLTLGISIKQGNGFAFYLLDMTKALSGVFYTGNNATLKSGDHGLSHANMWSDGDIGTGPAPIPLPAAGFLLLGGLGVLGLVRRRKSV